MTRNPIKEGLKSIGLGSPAVKELRERSQKESFQPGDYSKGSFGAVGDEISFIQTVYTGYLTDDFYKSKEDTIKESLILQKAMARKDPKFHAQVIRRARKEASIKDQVLIGVWANKNLKDVIKTLPPTTIEKLIDIHYKYGTRVNTTRKIIEEWFKALPKDKLEFYATKNKKSLQRMLQYAHLTVSDDDWSFIRQQSKYKGKNKVYLAVKEFSENGTVPKSIKLPYETVRGSSHKIPLDSIAFTPYQLLSFGKSLATKYGEAPVAKLLEKADGKRITSDKWFTAALAVHGDYTRLSNVMLDKYKESIETSYEKLLLKFGKQPRFTILFDKSGSMRGNVDKCLAMIVPFYKLINNFYAFDDNVYHFEPEFLKDIMNAREEINNNMRGTALFDALDKIKGRVGSNLIMVTDEQENESSLKTNRTIKEIIDNGSEVYVINPNTYKGHTTLKGITYLPAKNAESLASVIKFKQLRSVTQKDITKYFGASLDSEEEDAEEEPESE